VLLAALALGAATPRAETTAPELGSLDPFRPPTPKATELNAAGKAPYRAGKWDEARAQYRAAEAADPEFLAPRLNVACSFVRQERFAEATAEVEALVARAYVPWAREVLDAADLGALKVRPEGKAVEAAMAKAAAAWGAAAREGVLFVARQRPPLRVPDGAGVFLLNPHQEVWAYVPRTQRYLQVTAEDGHVVAMAPSPDGHRLVYVTAEKLVRGAAPDDVALRGVAVRELDLVTMTLGARAAVDGDVRRLAVLPPASGGATLVVALGERRPRTFVLGAKGALEPARISGRLGAPLVVLTGRGVEPVAGKPLPPKTGEGAGLRGLRLP